MEAKLFSGCVIPNRLPFIEKSSRLVFEKLGVKLEDAPFSCCPDPVGVGAISDKVLLTLGARNLCLAEKDKKKIVSLCNGCTETLLITKNTLEHDEESKKEVQDILKQKGYNYKGTAEVSHFIRTLIEDVGIDKIKKTVKKPLKGLKCATHTGCHYARPSSVINWDDALNPKYLDELVIAIGAEPVEYSEKNLCCGSGVSRTRKDIGLDISRKKLQSATDAGAEVFVLNCPSCFQQIEGDQRVVNKEFNTDFKIPVFYITELMALAFGFDPDELGLKFHTVKVKKILAKLGLSKKKSKK